MKLRLSIMALAVASSQAYASCGAAYCPLNTNWATQGVWVEPGARLDLRYEYIDQDQVRSGSGKASVSELANQDHIERETINRNLVAAFDYAFNERFGISVTAPLIDREHKHLHVEDDVEERWSYSKLGDVRVVGRVQLSSATNLQAAYGINIGLKLPTGQFTIANGDHERAERSLQPGTGTTDGIFGAYYHRALPAWHSSWFAQATLQQALDSRSGFKPGQSLATDIGYRYSLGENASLMLQANYVIKQRDRGNAAEPADSGSRTLTVSPGVSYAFTPSLQIYGFLHERVYQYVNGVQLSARQGILAGISARF
ncbi:MAG TPA: transporter [Spongiibacteraceae bacterium]|nr:transporter [Spongiibacteraceae bacterium]